MHLPERILIVDDHPNNVEFLEDVFGDDYQLATARSGEEALSVAATFRPALILLDIMMPGLDGYDTCRQLRATPTLRHTKIIMVSAKTMVAERLRGYEVGADDYITKPFNLDELRAKVRVYLRLKSLEEVDQLKSDVLALLSHETATPLNGILGPLRLVRETPEMGEAERTEFLDMIYHSATRLHTLYTKVCTLSTLLAGPSALSLETADVGAMIQQLVRAVTPRAAASGVQIDVILPEDATTRLDQQYIQAVITALLDNALRVSPAAGRVVIDLRRDNAGLCLRVTDQGPGISPEFLPRVFKPFAQPDLRCHTEGHGLSLAIAQQVILAHGGTIEVASTQGEGTTFTVRVPVVTS